MIHEIFKRLPMGNVKTEEAELSTRVNNFNNIFKIISQLISFSISNHLQVEFIFNLIFYNWKNIILFKSGKKWKFRA